MSLQIGIGRSVASRSFWRRQHRRAWGFCPIIRSGGVFPGRALVLGCVQCLSLPQVAAQRGVLRIDRSAMVRAIDRSCIRIPEAMRAVVKQASRREAFAVNRADRPGAASVLPRQARCCKAAVLAQSHPGLGKKRAFIAPEQGPATVLASVSGNPGRVARKSSALAKPGTALRHNPFATDGTPKAKTTGELSSILCKYRTIRNKETGKCTPS